MNNPYTIPGAAIGAKSDEQISTGADKVTKPVPRDKSLSQLGSRIISAADWHLDTLTDENRAPKYRADPEASYYGNGSLSILDRVGKFVFAKNTTDANQAAFKIDQGDSQFYSSLNQTTLGSLNIDTVDGMILNPLSAMFPSTNFTPTKAWIKKLFPTLTNKNLVFIVILELVQAALLRLNRSEETVTTSPATRTDMAQIIVDNQNIENRLFSQTLTQ